MQIEPEFRDNPSMTKELLMGKKKQITINLDFHGSSWLIDLQIIAHASYTSPCSSF